MTVLISSSVVIAEESNLIPPDRVDANVVFMQKHENENVDPSQLLQVFVGDRSTCCAGRSPVAGRYSISGNRVTFDPAFDLIEGQNYAVRSRSGGSAWEITQFSVQPADEVVRSRVVAIFPSGSEIPENLLRFYIHFSTPMKPHMSGEFIRLIDASGTADTAAFMSFKQELWSEDRTRLTLLMEPGRIKRGVTQNLVLGPALQNKKHYTLVIEEGWPSAQGEDKTPRFEKQIIVSQALRTVPDTELWKIVTPRISTRDPLYIEFDRPFDHQLAQAGIEVLDPNGHVIRGAVSLENHETTWRFEPQIAWSSRSIQIVVDARLEDVAGNNFRELLDQPAGAEFRIMDYKTLPLDLKPL